jgi:DNA-binding NarL/FixJ family response regulator
MQESCSAERLRVLLIEDNSADARLVQILLADQEETGVAFDLDRVSGLDGARDALGRERFDAVLLDLGLPDARGTDLVALVHEASPDAAIIVSSGQDANDCLLARAIIRKGAQDFLPKDGLSGPVLARTITTAVERQRRGTALRRRATSAETALTDAGIGRLSWLPDSPEATFTGDVEGLVGLAVAGPRLSLRRFLSRLSASARRSLYAAWRELRAGADRLAVVLLEHDPSPLGHGRDLLLDIAVQRDSGNRIVRLDALIRDTAMVGHVERLESEMIHHLGHELRTPLTTIRATLELLAHEAEARLTGTAKGMVENAIANADRINRVIGETLGSAVERPPSGHLQPRRVALGPYLCDELAARLPGHATATSGAGPMLTSSTRTLDVMVETAGLRRAVDCLCVELRSSEGRAEGLVLDVSLAGDVAWLKPAPSPAAMAGVLPEQSSGNGDSTPTRPAPRADAAQARGLCIALPLAA